MTTTAPTTPTTQAPSGTLGGERKGWVEQAALLGFIAVPFVAVLAAVPVAWGGWLGWSDVLLSFVFYAVSGHGITVGFHRYLTHGSFKARRPLRIGLAIAGSMAIEGPAVRWVADHRKHHKFSDKEGDPHSPWRYGETVPALDQGSLARPHGVAVRRRADLAAPVRARPAQATATSSGSAARSCRSPWRRSLSRRSWAG